MSSSPSTHRQPLHDRTIRLRSYAREDGLYDLEAELLDVKAYDFETRRGVHRAGQPVHHMHVRVTIDAGFTIVDAAARYDAAPYGERCAGIAPEYADLIGMNLLRGFRHSVKARFGRTAGCIHMSELAAVLPTAAVQTMSGRDERSGQREPAERPFHLDGCHALRVDGPVVAKEYPRWYMAPAAGDDGHEQVGAALDAVIPSSSSDS